MSYRGPGAPAVVLLLAFLAVAGAVSGADSADEERVMEYQWTGATPVDAFVCNPTAGCPGYVVAETDWIDDLPGDAPLTGVDVALEWTSVDDTVGPMVLRLTRLDANGMFVENLVNLEAAVSPIDLSWSGEAFRPGEFGRLTVWPAAKAVVGPVAVYVDVSEQPFHVSGALRFPAP